MILLAFISGCISPGLASEISVDGLGGRYEVRP